MKLKRAGKDAAPAEGAEETPAGKRGGNNLIPAIVIAVGLLGGGFFMGNGGSTAGATPAEPPAHDKADGPEETATHGPVQSLDPITLNLADGRFLKVGLALQMAEGDGGHGGGEEVAPAKALDLAISLLGSYTMEELSTPKARELVKKKLSEQVAEVYIDHETHEPLVTKVYFTEFVMQ